jgi:hypothetical protein
LVTRSVKFVVSLLGRLHAVEEWLPVAVNAAASLVDHQRRVHLVAVILEQPVDAVRGAALLVRGQRDDDVTVGDVALLLRPEDVRDEDRRHRLVVGRAAPVVVAVPLREDERVEIGRPVGLERLDDVEMREEQQRPARARAAADPRNDVVLLGARTADEDVGLGNAGIAEALRHRDRRRRHVARRHPRVDLDQLLVDLAGDLLVRVQRAGRVHGRTLLRGEREGEGEGECKRRRDSEADVTHTREAP